MNFHCADPLISCIHDSSPRMPITSSAAQLDKSGLCCWTSPQSPYHCPLFLADHFDLTLRGPIGNIDQSSVFRYYACGPMLVDFYSSNPHPYISACRSSIVLSPSGTFGFPYFMSVFRRASRACGYIESTPSRDCMGISSTRFRTYVSQAAYQLVQCPLLSRFP